MTLVELLVVIAIIGVLASLILPAIQSARESARIAVCKNNLKQIGLAALSHASSQGHLPAGGWGWWWIGDPDRGSGRGQPGGWFFNSLPYLELTSLHGSQTGKTGADRLHAASLMIQTPVPVMSCPSRRPPQALPTQNSAGTQPFFAAVTTRLARADYAACGGDVVTHPGSHGSSWGTGGPPSVAAGESGTANFACTAKVANGVSFSGSTISLDTVRDGCSHTYLVGEKYLQADAYLTGICHGDNESLYIGANEDISRWTGIGLSPTMDRKGLNNTQIFGSAHLAGFAAVFCDGSVHMITYSVDPETHRRLGNRKDGLPSMDW